MDEILSTGADEMDGNKIRFRRRMIACSLVTFFGLGLSPSLGGLPTPPAKMVITPVSVALLNPFTLAMVANPLAPGLGTVDDSVGVLSVSVAPLVLPVTPADSSPVATTPPSKSGGGSASGGKQVPPVVVIVSAPPPVPPSSVFNP